MYFCIDRITVDHDLRPLVLTDAKTPLFAWSAQSDRDGAYQSAYRLTVTDEGGDVLWDSGRVESALQRAVYGGTPLKSGVCCTVTLTLWDDAGAESPSKSAAFRYLAPRTFTGKRITVSSAYGDAREKDAKYFHRAFTLTELPIRATLYASAAGYQYVTVNGTDPDRSFLNPATTNYNELCYYTVTDMTDALVLGRNGIFAVVGDGWRNLRTFFKSHRKTRGDGIFYFGDTSFIADLVLTYADGREETIGTDETWYAGYGAITENSVYNGECYDARLALPLWDTPAFDDGVFLPAEASKDTLGALLPQALPPVTEQRRLTARTVFRRENAYILDFGENIAGVGALRIPEGLPVGTEIKVEYAEELLPSGDLSRATLRSAKAADIFTVGETNPEVWIPHLTYHGFRYAKITGLLAPPTEDTLTAIVFCNDIRSNSFFRCGDPLINQLYENIIRTEMGNLHHLATDCPQRDERMGWMNDATVRFENSPYNFRMGQLFRKISRDIVAEQDPVTGGIPDTAPLMIGSRPADPVCSSFLVMGLETAMHYGDTETIRTYYEAYKRWTDCLAKMRTEEGILEYSLYGDWAGPADYCKENQHRGVQSNVTPNALMSTGYLFYNFRLLASFAKLLGKDDEKEAFLSEAEKVRAAYLKKWFYRDQGCYVATGSQGAQAFSLWLGILPKECENAAAKRMFEAVKNVGYRLTTGNLTTKYLIDMLAKYGYTDAAWKILTRKEYPSWGYMIEHGATTVWERFEQKYDASMNSHNHPMYGAVGYFFYAYLLGITPTGYSFEHFRVSPVYPEELMYAEGRVDTEMGEIYVKWQRDIGGIALFVNVPFGMTATVSLPEGEQTVSSGCHHFFFEEN